MKRAFLGICLALSLSAQQRSFYQQTDLKGQEIGKLTGDTYYARMDDYVSVFMVTPEGIVLVEPIGLTRTAEPPWDALWWRAAPGCNWRTALLRPATQRTMQRSRHPSR